jgi:hypothetical protein
VFQQRISDIEEGLRLVHGEKLIRFLIKENLTEKQRGTPFRKPQIKRVRRDPFQLEPSYISIPVANLITFDVFPGFEDVPRLSSHSVNLLRLPPCLQEINKLICKRCKAISATTTAVPCSCEVLCYTCKDALHRKSNNDLGRIVGKEWAFVIHSGHSGTPTSTTYSSHTSGLLKWLVGNCTAICECCHGEYASLQALQVHMQACVQQSILPNICKSISCVDPIDTSCPHHCLYDKSAAKAYAKVSAGYRLSNSPQILIR